MELIFFYFLSHTVAKGAAPHWSRRATLEQEKHGKIKQTPPTSIKHTRQAPENKANASRINFKQSRTYMGTSLKNIMLGNLRIEKSWNGWNYRVYVVWFVAFRFVRFVFLRNFELLKLWSFGVSEIRFLCLVLPGLCSPTSASAQSPSWASDNGPRRGRLEKCACVPCMVVSCFTASRSQGPSLLVYHFLAVV